MDKMKADLRTMRAHLADLESSQRMSVHEIDGMKVDLRAMGESISSLQGDLASLQGSVSSLQVTTDLLGLRVGESHKATSGMLGVFSSIESHMVRAFEEQASTLSWRDQIESRLEALERRHPPAA